MRPIATRLLYGLLCVFISRTASANRGYDDSDENGVCGAGMWSVLPSGFVCAELTGSDKFRYFRRSPGCLMWHRGTKNWFNADAHCKDLGIAISQPVKLALPATAMQRLQWGWRSNNYWGGARRQAGSSKEWASYISYGSNTNEVEDPADNGVWDNNQPSGTNKDNEIDGDVEENCLQIRGNMRWNDESCTDQNSFYCYLPMACRVCYTGSCKVWHTRRECTSTSDSICVECSLIDACGDGSTPDPAGGCTCVSCVAGSTYKSAPGLEACSTCSTAACGTWQRRSVCTVSSDSTCQACPGKCIGRTPAVGCDCIPCNKDEIFDGTECRRPREMQIYKGMQGFEIEGADHIKSGPTTEISVSRTNSRGDSIMYYRSGYNTQDPCTCMNDRDFAHLCGHSIVMNQDAYLRTESEHRLLSSFAHNTDTIDDDRRGVLSFKIERRGVCMNCLKCNAGSFNPNCPTNMYQEGNCLPCKTLALDCLPGQYLNHVHPLGCEFDSVGTDYFCQDCQTYMKNSTGYFLLVGCGATDFVRWPHTHYLASSSSLLVTETCMFETGSPMCMWGAVTLERKTPFGSHSLEIPYCPPGYFFSCKGGDIPLTSDTYSVRCCSKCRDCDVASGLKRGSSYRDCSGHTDIDTQYTQCQVRCENNMYENTEGQCVECTTCREGEL